LDNRGPLRELTPTGEVRASVRRVVRNEGVEKEQHSGGNQRTAQEKKTDEGQRVRQGERKHLEEKPYSDQQTGPTDTALH
jgi:hypothetical protein